MAKKPEISLLQTRIVGGLWEGALSGVSGEAPLIEATHAGRVIEGVEVTPLPGKSGRHVVRVPIPAWAVNEGVQTILIRLGEAVLAEVTLAAGQPADDDLRAEVSLLRAELDLLKRAFRRHCTETGG
jgi:hypothetical protein